VIRGIASMNNGVMAAGEGRSIWVVGDRYTIKCSGNDTSGAYALLEAVVPPGAGPPPHIHSREDEAFFVLEGELQFHVEGRSFMASSAAWVTLARGSVHFFKNTGSEPARMLIVVTPAGLEDFFLEIGREAIDGETELVTRRPKTSRSSFRLLQSTGLRSGCPLVIRFWRITHACEEGEATRREVPAQANRQAAGIADASKECVSWDFMMCQATRG